MNHLSEEELVLAHYGEEAGSREHLEACPDCRAALEALRRDLAGIAFTPPPERGEDYGAQVWYRIRPRLPERRRRFAWWPAALAVASLVVGAFLAGRHWPAGTGPAPVGVAQVRERVLLVALGDHLERSQMVLVELENAGGGSVDIAEEQRRAEDLLSANRLYRQTALSAGQPGVASVLDDLERALIEIVHSPSRASSAEFEALRKRIEAQGILFKVRVMDSRIRAGSRSRL